MWQRLSEQVGCCRANPPPQVRDIRNEWVDPWPQTAPADWCGRFAEQPAAGAKPSTALSANPMASPIPDAPSVSSGAAAGGVRGSLADDFDF